MNCVVSGKLLDVRVKGDRYYYVLYSGGQLVKIISRNDLGLEIGKDVFLDVSVYPRVSDGRPYLLVFAKGVGDYEQVGQA